MAFSIVHESSDSARSYSLELDDASLGEETDGPCSVRVVEGANTYEGACGSGDPSEDRPCQVSLRIEKDVLRGSIYCANIASDASSAITRHVVAPISTEPATFEIYGCSGI